MQCKKEKENENEKSIINNNGDRCISSYSL